MVVSSLAEKKLRRSSSHTSILTALRTSQMESKQQSDILIPLPKDCWVNAPLEARLKHMNNEMFVPHPEMTVTMLAIKNRIKRCLQEDKGAAIFVEAPSGGGKTTLIRYFKKNMPDEVTDEETKVRVVSFSVPKVVTLKGMDTALLLALGDPKAGTGNHYDLDKRAITLLTRAGTEVIFIDNIQDIPEKRRAGGILQLGNWIRDLIDTSRRLVVLLGTKDSRTILQSNIQLMRRCPAKKVISYFNVKDPSRLKHFARFLREIDKRLPLAELSGLGEANDQTTFQIACATGGIHDYIFQILSAALSRAVSDGRERISQEDLAGAFNETFQDLGIGLNPFLGKVKHILDREGEPLYGLLDSGTPELYSASAK